MLSSFACFGVILWYMFLPYRQTVGKQLVWVHPKASCFSNQSGLIGDVFLTDWWTPAKLQSSFLLTTYWNFTEMTLVWVHNEMKNNISIVIHSFKNTLRLILLNRDLQTRAEVRTVRGCRYEPYLSSLWCVPWETWCLPGLRQMKVRWCERTSLQRARCGTLRALWKAVPKRVRGVPSSPKQVCRSGTLCWISSKGLGWKACMARGVFFPVQLLMVLSPVRLDKLESREK